MAGAGSGGTDIGELRHGIDVDRKRLASLDDGSPAHRRLRRQILRRSAKLRRLEQDVRLRAVQVNGVRLVAVVVGAGLILAGWGSWKLLIGVAVAAFGAWVAGRLPEHFYRTGLGFHRRAR